MTTTHRFLFSLAAVLFSLATRTAAAQVLVIEARVAPTPTVQTAPVVTAPASRVVVAPAAPSYAPDARYDAPRTRPVWRAVGIGAGIFGASWALNVVGSGLWMLAPESWNRSGDFFYWSLVPLVGPWAQMGSMTEPSWQTPVLAIDGLLQLAGFVTAIIGQSTRETVATRDAAPTFSLIPMVSPQTLGLAAAGTF